MSLPNLDSELATKLLRLEKSGKLYAYLINKPEKVLRYGLAIPKITCAADYSQKLLPFAEYWEAYNSIEGCAIKHAKKTVLNNRGWQIPRWLIITDANCAFRLINKDSMKKRFIEAYDLIVERYPELSDWCIEHARDFVNPKGILGEDVIHIADYIKSGPQYNCNIKQWQFSGIDTKFHKKHFEILRSLVNVLLNLELKNRDEFFSYFGLEKDKVNLEIILLHPSMFFNGSSHAAMTSQDMAKWIVKPQYVFIFENKANGSIVEKNLERKYPCIIVCGVGKAISVLKDVPWLCGCNVYYAGDFDRRGYEMLSDVRKFLPETESLLMDYDTLRSVSQLNKKHREKRSALGIPLLTPSERKALTCVVESDWRIEQEKYCDLLTEAIKEILEKAFP